MQSRYGLALVAIVALFTVGVSMQPQDAYASHTTTICHFGSTITVATVAVPAHLAHGDTVGACPPPPTFEVCHGGVTLEVTFGVLLFHLTSHPSDYFGACIVPPADDDEDGIPNDDDECPSEPETVNGYLDEDGCPDEVPIEDEDEDGIPDEVDQCPAEPETFNEFQDEDGCPDSKKKNGDCVNCQPPTLGLNKGGDISPDKRLVEGGFSCEGQTVDVDNFYTPFPKIVNPVGDPLNCTFKIYEDTGADKIVHFEFAVGKRVGDSMSAKQGKITWDKNIMTNEVIVRYDENLFRDVSLVASDTLVKCRSDSEDARCLQMNLSATPKEPLVKEIIVMTNVWDSNRNGKVNYYNDGIDFVGNSENPLPSFNILDGKNGMVTIYTLDPTLENLTHGVDKFGQNWYNVDGFWTKEFIPDNRSCDTSYQGFDRNCPEFSMQKLGQILLAKQYFDSSKIQKVLPDSYAHKYPERD